MTKKISLPWPVLILIIISAYLAGNIRNNVNQKTNNLSRSKTTRIKNVLFQPLKSNTPNIEIFRQSFEPKNKILASNLENTAQFFNQKVNWQPHYYFFTSNQPENENQCLAAENNQYYCTPKGKQQLNQNIREICAWKITNNGTKWWNFVNSVEENCSLENTDYCWQEQADVNNLLTNEIQDCFSTQSIQILENEITALKNKNIQQTPKIFINGTELPINPQENGHQMIVKIENNYFQNNQIPSSEYLVASLCSAFVNPPNICN